MKIEIKIDENCSETRLIVVANKMTDEIALLMQRLSAETQQEIVGFCDGSAVILQLSTVIRIYACNGKVFAETNEQEYQLRLRLYEVEEKLAGRTFVRISNSEIVNLKCIQKFDLNLAGTICVLLSNGKITYASRRYVSKIKKTLGL